MNSHKHLIKIAFWCFTVFLGIAPLVSLVFPPQGGRIHYQPISLYRGEDAPTPAIHKTPYGPDRTRQFASREPSVRMTKVNRNPAALQALAGAFSPAQVMATGVRSLEFPRAAQTPATGFKINKDALALASTRTAGASSGFEGISTSSQDSAAPEIKRKKHTLDLSILGDNNEVKAATPLVSAIDEEKTQSRIAKALNSITAKDRDTFGIVVYRF